MTTILQECFVGIWGHDDWEEETALGVFEVLNVSTLTFGLDGTWQTMTHTEIGSTICFQD
jgi:hypothetical protein